MVFFFGNQTTGGTSIDTGVHGHEQKSRHVESSTRNHSECRLQKRQVLALHKAAAFRSLHCSWRKQQRPSRAGKGPPPPHRARTYPVPFRQYPPTPSSCDHGCARPDVASCGCGSCGCRCRRRGGSPTAPPNPRACCRHRHRHRRRRRRRRRRAPKNLQNGNKVNRRKEEAGIEGAEGQAGVSEGIWTREGCRNGDRSDRRGGKVFSVGRAWSYCCLVWRSSMQTPSTRADERPEARYHSFEAWISRDRPGQLSDMPTSLGPCLRAFFPLSPSCPPLSLPASLALAPPRIPRSISLGALTIGPVAQGLNVPDPIGRAVGAAPTAHVHCSIGIGHHGLVVLLALTLLGFFSRGPGKLAAPAVFDHFPPPIRRVYHHRRRSDQISAHQTGPDQANHLSGSKTCNHAHTELLLVADWSG